MTVCQRSADIKDHLQSLGRLSPDDQPTVGQVRVSNFTNRNLPTVGQPLADDLPIVDRRCPTWNQIPNPKDSRPVYKKYNWSVINIHSKKQLKSHTKLAN